MNSEKPLRYSVASTIQPVKPEWAWQPRIPSRGLTMIFGEAGMGKSTMVIDLIARWTTGRNMPETVGGPFKPINVAVYGFEDDLSSVVVPRLMAAEADLTRVFFLEVDKNRTIIPDQIPELNAACQKLECKILILDNIENGMGIATDTNNSKSLRGALNPLGELGFPVLAIHHPKKNSVFVDPVEAMGGSQAYTNVARSTMMVIPTDDTGTTLAFCSVKNNLSPKEKTRTLYYTFKSKELDGLGEISCIEWLGGDHVSAKEWVRRAKERLNQKPADQGASTPRRASDFLKTEYPLKEKGKKENAKTESIFLSGGILKGTTDSTSVNTPRRDSLETNELTVIQTQYSNEDTTLPITELIYGVEQAGIAKLRNSDTKASIHAINEWVETERQKHQIADYDEEVPF